MDIVITAGIGEKAKEILEQKGIEVVVGAPRELPEGLVHKYLSNDLVTGSNVCEH